MKDKKKEIIKLLRKESELSTSRIAFMINSNYWRTERLLWELKEDKKVIRKQGKSGVYWSLKIKK